MHRSEQPRLPRILGLWLALLGLAGTAAAGTPLPVPEPPAVSARSYILIDYHSGRVLAEHDADRPVEPASLTKLLTAYVVFHELAEGRLSPQTPVTISEKAWRMPGSRTFVEVGHKVPVEILLKGMIIQSGNDATVALAEQVAGSEETFAALMNQYAARLGMTASHFVNSTGLPAPEHRTTARDLAILTRALIRDFPQYYPLYSEKRFTWNEITQYNRNKLLWRDETVDGVKTGHTESAGYCLVSSAERDGMRLIAVVLGDRSEDARAASSQALLNYGFRFFETHRLYAGGEALQTVPVYRGEADEVAAGLREDLWVTFPRGARDRLQAAAEVPGHVLAPVHEDQELGTLEVRLGDELLASRPLVALAAVAEGAWWKRLLDDARLWFE